MKVLIREVAKKNNGWNLVQLANAMGKPKQTICYWANGQTMPNPKNLELLCNILECTLDDIFIIEKRIITIS